MKVGIDFNWEGVPLREAVELAREAECAGLESAGAADDMVAHAGLSLQDVSVVREVVARAGGEVAACASTKPPA